MRQLFVIIRRHNEQEITIYGLVATSLSYFYFAPLGALFFLVLGYLVV